METKKRRLVVTKGEVSLVEEVLGDVTSPESTKVYTTIKILIILDRWLS
jgi:hypothetical protein